MDRCEVLIVGGGPAGSTCATRLRQAGIDVIVLDRKAFPRDKICAGWVTPAVWSALGVTPEAYARDGRTLQPITGFRTGIIGGAEVDTRYDTPVSYGIRRFEFDAYLLERSGARRVTAPLKSLERTDDGWIADGAIAARLVIGAGGHFCPVARELGAALGQSEQIVAAQEIEFPLTDAQRAQSAADGHVPELYFCDDLKGYGWVVRKGAYLNVGLGREDNHKLAEHVATFARWLKQKGRVPQDMPEKFGGHAYLLYNHAARPLLADRALLIGDAAGLAYPQSGEGIRPAVESAVFAADTIVAAAGDYREAALAPYRDRMLARFGQRQAASLLDHMPEGLKRFAATRLMANAWFTRHVVIDKWFLHTEQPALVA
ncbi:MAG: NAD(P)/FAD-dependent oxidoreductase [Burkholderiales bacterium]|jgi:geranylgeranyl reductase family protein|nr:NAD(P)/FAD-dependent oxidoreductase [Burkholderiales bacterium]